MRAREREPVPSGYDMYSPHVRAVVLYRPPIVNRGSGGRGRHYPTRVRRRSVQLAVRRRMEAALEAVTVFRRRLVTLGVVQRQFAVARGQILHLLPELLALGELLLFRFLLRLSARSATWKCGLETHLAIWRKSGSITFWNSAGSITSRISSSSFRNITSFGLCVFGQNFSKHLMTGCGKREPVDDAAQDLEQLRDPVMVLRLVDELVENVVDLLADERAQPEELAVHPVQHRLQEVPLPGVLRVEQLQQVQNEAVVDVALCHVRLEVRRLQEPQEQLVHELQDTSSVGSSSSGSNSAPFGLEEGGSVRNRFTATMLNASGRVLNTNDLPQTAQIKFGGEARCSVSTCNCSFGHLANDWSQYLQLCCRGTNRWNRCQDSLPRSRNDLQQHGQMFCSELRSHSFCRRLPPCSSRECSINCSSSVNVCVHFEKQQ
uniref:Uncharacterized protein n=1 Tax=Anopheles atroparvus TaxID=41427 RepID=A0A182IZZ8_ANOAO